MSKGSTHERFDLSTFRMRQLVEIDACTRCSSCVSFCPVRTYGQDDSLAPISKIEDYRKVINKQYGLRARLFGRKPITDEEMTRLTEQNMKCLLCNRCKEVCPVKIDTRELWISIRENLASQGHYLEVIDQVRQSIKEKYNITGDEPEMRTQWQADLEIPAEKINYRKGAKVVYFVGCVASLYPMTYGIPQSLSKIMVKAGVDFTTLGGEEHCCGYPLIIAGMRNEARETVRHNVEKIREIGAKVVVASCPSCFHTFAHEYPQILGEELGFQVVHSTQFLAKLLAEGDLKLTKPVEELVTYHDPCDLGRNSGVYEAPRQVLVQVPGLQLVEMAENREMSLCCGGGGDVEMVDPELGAKVTRTRLAMAQDAGANTIVSACQQCKRRLSTQAKKDKVKVKVLDVVEVVAEAAGV